MTVAFADAGNNEGSIAQKSDRASPAKSFTSALVGLALEQECHSSVDQKMIDFFPEFAEQIDSPRKEGITIHELLQMRSGYPDEEYTPPYFEILYASANWHHVPHLVDFPLTADPGTEFQDSNLGSHLLAVLVARACDSDLLSFSQAHLFARMGAEVDDWYPDADECRLGGMGIFVSARDMAKFGLAFLDNGMYAGQQIIDADWVRNSLTSYSEGIRRGGEKPHDMARIGQLYLQKGRWGERQIVPARWVAESTTAHSYHKKFRCVPDRDGNPAAQAELASLSGPPEPVVTATRAPALPACALTISGATYSLEANNWNYDNFQLQFDPDNPWATFSYSKKRDQRVAYRVGLDNVYRLADTSEGTFAAVGGWTAADTFTIEYELLGYSTRGKWTLTFDQNEIAVVEEDVTGTYRYGGSVGGSEGARAQAGGERRMCAACFLRLRGFTQRNLLRRPGVGLEPRANSQLLLPAGLGRPCCSHSRVKG